MPELTPSFVFEYERRMKAITEDEYVRRMSALYWNKICRTTNIEGKTERITWLLNTATIEPLGPTLTGGMAFEDMVTQTVEYPTFRHGKGIKVQRDQIEDLDGTGLNILGEWSKQIGGDMAYYPQRLAAQMLLNGANTDGSANAYDGVPFFADTTTNSIGGQTVAGHPYNPYNPSLGGYQNWCHGSPSTVTQPNGATLSYPGALPIDYSVSVDVALQNLGKAISWISANRMPNGVDPRFLEPAYVIAPPQLAPRLRQLMDAKFIAQAASSGGGSGDVKALIEGWGMGTPVIAQEIGAATTYFAKIPFIPTTAGANGTPGSGGVSFKSETVTGSDTTWYIVCKENQTSTLGGLLYVLRKPFKVTYYTGDSGGTGMTETLDRANEFEYHCQGRMAVQFGHPYAIYRFDAT